MFVIFVFFPGNVPIIRSAKGNAAEMVAEVSNSYFFILVVIAFVFALAIVYFVHILFSCTTQQSFPGMECNHTSMSWYTP